MPTEKDSPRASLEKERARQQRKSAAAEQDDYLEEALEETFPASDPIAPGDVKDHRTGQERSGCDKGAPQEPVKQE